jgi:hypothetical protein
VVSMTDRWRLRFPACSGTLVARPADGRPPIDNVRRRNAADSHLAAFVVSVRLCSMPVNIRDGGPLATGEVIGDLHDD